RVLLVWLGQPAIVNLRLVALLVLSRQAAEEDAAIELLAVAFAFDLQDEVGPLAFGLQVTGAVFQVDPAFLADGPFRFLAGMLFPAGEVFAVEDRVQVERAQTNVAEVEGGPSRYFEFHSILVAPADHRQRALSQVFPTRRYRLATDRESILTSIKDCSGNQLIPAFFRGRL